MSLTFTLSHSPPTPFGPRVGQIAFPRLADCPIPTPGLLTTTSRGVIPHLSRDHAKSSPAIRWVHIPFQSFLEHSPPLPTAPLHSYLGFNESRQILSLSLRDPFDTRELPPNGNSWVSATCMRGVRKVLSSDWVAYVKAAAPDVVFALADTPFTHSQKRLTKSLDRSLRWLSDIVNHNSSNILVTLPGGPVPAARTAFAESLVSEGLDDAVAGYVVVDTLDPLLIHASLRSLPTTKPRLAMGTHTTPHAILRLVRDVGVDIFDSAWAQTAASWGVALDFTFPAPSQSSRTPVGRNLYEPIYATDFTPLSTTTHAYLHHLLHTHEMSAHVVLVLHNLAVLDAFFEGVRTVINTGAFDEEVKRFQEVYREEQDAQGLLATAHRMWVEVDLARGKGRLARERNVQ